MSTRNFKLFVAGIIILLASCRSNQDSTPASTTESNFHKITVQDVLQASEYTYLHVKENDLWLAVPSVQVKVGETYYYEGGVEMKKFESKELNKVFESIILLEKLNSEPKSSAIIASNKPYNNTQPATSQAPATTEAQTPTSAPASAESYTRTPPVIEKKQVKVAPASGGVTIAKLFADKNTYAGKTVKIKGQVTKYTPAVMGKNWIHIQDGTDFDGKFDLTVTSDNEVKVGDVVTLEGKVGLNKDLGYGYFFDVIVEEAGLK